MKHGQTAPMFAAMAEHPSILQLLCTLKFNINWTDNVLFTFDNKTIATKSSLRSLSFIRHERDGS